MQTAELIDIVSDLANRAACDLETQSLEFKGWCRDEKELSATVSEAVVCLANSQGGYVIVGVDDKGPGWASIRPCPHAAVTPDWLRKRIRDLTKPPVACTVVRFGEILPQPQKIPGSDLLVVEVPKTSNPSGHRTIRGISLIRVDNECRTDYLVDEDDYTAFWLESSDLEVLDQRSLECAIERRCTTFPTLADLGSRPVDHLETTGLARPRETTLGRPAGSRVPSLACLLLLGKEAYIKAELPAAETVLCVENDVLAPLTSSNWFNILESLDRYLQAIQETLVTQKSLVPQEAIRELLLNAYLHRCYRTTGPIQIRIAQGEVEIRNPGGLLGDLTASNLLYSPAVYRNFALADAARQFGLCEKAGTGLDKVFKQLVADGLDFPYIEALGHSFKAIIRTRRDVAFAKFVRDCSGTLQLTLTELVVLRVLRTKCEASMDLLATKAQRPLDYLEDVLRDLEKRNLVLRNRQTALYRLSDATADRLAMYDDHGQLRLL